MACGHRGHIQYSPFPPEVFLYTGAHAGHEVVEVHDDVDSHVKKPTEGGVASPNKPDRKICIFNLIIFWGGWGGGC